MATPDPGRWRRARRRRQPAAAPSGPTAVPAADSFEPHLVPLLDLLAECIAHHIVTSAGDQCQPETLGATPRAPAGTEGSQPGIAGPSSTVPVQSHSSSHPSPTKPRRRTRRQAQAKKEAPRASD